MPPRRDLTLALLVLVGLALLALNWRIYEVELSMKMQAGRFDRKVVIQRPVVVRDAHGGEVRGWVDVCSCWAEFATASGAEEFRADQISNRQQSQFTIRYRPGINPQMSVIFDGERYDIVNVAEKGPKRRDWLVLTVEAREVESGG